MKQSDLKVSFNYANALFSFASDMNMLDTVYEDCILWQKILQFEPVINVIFSSPICNSDRKIDLFNGFSIDKISNASKSLFYLLVKNKRAALWENVIDCFIKKYLKYKNIIETNVITSKSLDPEKMEKIRMISKNVFDCDEVILNNIVDKNIVGGFVLESNTSRYDRSLLSMFNNLKKNLLNT